MDFDRLFNDAAQTARETHAHAARAVAAHRATRPDVWLVWVNETVVGVLENETKALDLAEQIRRGETFAADKWRALEAIPGRRYRWGSTAVARLEAEARRVG